MFVMSCRLYCSGPELSAEDSEEAEKVGNMEPDSYRYDSCLLHMQYHILSVLTISVFLEMLTKNIC